MEEERKKSKNREKRERVDHTTFAIQFRNSVSSSGTGVFETFQDDLSKPVAAFVAGLGFRRDLHMSAEPAEPPGGALWLL